MPRRRRRRRTVLTLFLVLALAGLGLAVVVGHGGRTPAAKPPVALPGPTWSKDASRWVLDWHDEFDGTTLDHRRWNVENRSTYGDGNGELACLMDRPQNLDLRSGVLRLTARREQQGLPCGSEDYRFPQGRPYSSAMISTKGTASWRYGRFQIRARLPVAPGKSKGLWPAFWMRPDDGGLGEVDVLEALGSNDPDPDRIRVHQTMWYDYTGKHKQQSHSEALTAVGSVSGWHTYALDWSPTHLRWYLDGRLVFERTPTTTPWFTEAFTRPFFLRLNLALGGRWPGSPTAQTELPASFDVDYVRVWRRR
ncbi:MAG: hypothetical protein JWR42_2949 [Marmoricola sp.]|nr:hypothetical protein [Marmoricola sp.]